VDLTRTHDRPAGVDDFGKSDPASDSKKRCGSLGTTRTHNTKARFGRTVAEKTRHMHRHPPSPRLDGCRAPASP